MYNEVTILEHHIQEKEQKNEEKHKYKHIKYIKGRAAVVQIDFDSWTSLKRKNGWDIIPPIPIDNKLVWQGGMCLPSNK